MACGRLPVAMAGPVLLPSPQREQPAVTFGVACLALAALASSSTASCPAMPVCSASSIVACPASGAPGAGLAERLAGHHRQLLTAEEWQQLGCERSLAGRRTDQITHICACHEAALSQPAAAQIESSLFPVSRGWQQEAASPPLISWCRAGYGAVPPVPLGCCASRCARRACGRPLTPEPDAAPAGLTARATEGQARNARGGPPRHGAYQEDEGNPRLFGT